MKAIRSFSSQQSGADTCVTPIDEQSISVVRERDPASLLTVPEVAALLHVPRSWIYDHVRPGCSNPLPVIRIGKYLRFQMRDLAAYIDSLSTKAAR
jgi:excisionase family DNA binding protein